MKKLILVLIIIIAVTIAYLLMRETEPVTPPNVLVENVDTGFRPNPENATFIFEDGSITLVRGKSEVSIAPGSALVEEVLLSDKIAYGDINNDNKNDAAVIITRQGGGSGSFVYVASFVSGLVTYRGSNAIFLGDRIAVQSITINSGVIRVNILERREDEPLAADPTIPVTKEFVFVGDELRDR